MKLTFINVGYGEAILGECPSENSSPFRFLIDGGSAEPDEYENSSSGRIHVTEYFHKHAIQHLDLLISTHIHEDHICAALQVAQELFPNELWQTVSPTFYSKILFPSPNLAKTPSQSKCLRALNDYQSLCRLICDTGGKIRQILSGQIIHPIPGLTITALSPNQEQAADLEQRMYTLNTATSQKVLLTSLTELDSQMNNFSLILLLDWYGTKILLPGDTNCHGYSKIDPSMLQADLFKVGHHGQIDGADSALLKAVQPKAVVCCASSDQRYNSANPVLLKKIAAQGANMYFSDCPPVPNNSEIFPHNSLVFTIGPHGALHATYQ